MTLFGYARVSTTDQDLGIQEAALRAAGCQTIRSEKKSGTERGARTELQILLDFLREGDTLVVTRIDRLARPSRDLPLLDERTFHFSDGGKDVERETARGSGGVEPVRQGTEVDPPRR